MTSLPMWIALDPADAFNLLVLASLTDDRTAGEQATLDRLAAGVSRLAEGKETPAHLVPTVTGRGFKHMPAIVDDQDREVHVYESSRAESPHIWLSVENNDIPSAFVGLTLEDVKRLRDQIDYLIRNHYQREP